MKWWGPFFLFLIALNVVHPSVAEASKRLPAGICEKFRRTNNQMGCLACNIHYESHSESVVGQKAVGYVTLNRVALGYAKARRSKKTNFCRVIFASAFNKKSQRRECAFEWVCRGWDRTRPIRRSSWRKAVSIAGTVMKEYRRGRPDPRAGGAACATHFIAMKVQKSRGWVPWWAKKFKRLKKIGAHTFMTNTRVCAVKTKKGRYRVAKVMGWPLKFKKKRRKQPRKVRRPTRPSLYAFRD